MTSLQASMDLQKELIVQTWELLKLHDSLWLVFVHCWGVIENLKV